MYYQYHVSACDVHMRLHLQLQNHSSHPLHVSSLHTLVPTQRFSSGTHMSPALSAMMHSIMPWVQVAQTAEGLFSMHAAVILACVPLSIAFHHNATGQHSLLYCALKYWVTTAFHSAASAKSADGTLPPDRRSPLSPAQ